MHDTRRLSILLLIAYLAASPARADESVATTNLLLNPQFAFHAFTDEDHFARVVDLDEIRGNDYNLKLSRYVQTPVDPEPVDMPQAIRKLLELRARRDEAEAQMFSHLTDLGYEL